MPGWLRVVYQVNDEPLTPPSGIVYVVQDIYSEQAALALLSKEEEGKSYKNYEPKNKNEIKTKNTRKTYD